MIECVLDASAVLAFLHREPGYGEVERLLDAAAISAVNVAEVAAKLIDRGAQQEQVREAIAALGLRVVAFDEELAFRAAALAKPARSSGLSLGDRACLATAQALNLSAITADRSWSRLKLPINIQVVR